MRFKVFKILLTTSCLAPALWPLATLSGPTVVPTAEGQIGETPAAGNQVIGSRLSRSARKSAKYCLEGCLSPAAQTPSPPEFAFLTDRLNLSPNPSPVNSFPGAFENVARLPPSSARGRNAADNGDFVVFSFAVDGAAPDTMTVRIATFNEVGSAIVDTPITNIPTFVPPGPVPPDPNFANTGIAVDNQGRVTVTYTEFNNNAPRVMAQRLDGSTGQLLGGNFPITDGVKTDADIALLDPAGNRLVVANFSFNNNAISGNIVDTTGPTPVVLPEFLVSTTPGDTSFPSNVNPAVAADRSTGNFTIVWEHFPPGAPVSDPVNIRARRFDAQGNPIGNDFLVNGTTAGSQGQPAIAYGTGGESVVVWASAAMTAQEELDVFAQVYDANGEPIGEEFQVNTQTLGLQDKPSVRWLPDPDPRGREQFAIVWRDVVGNGDNTANGTGTSYRCFSIGAGDPSAVFADGFESGDTTSWCDRK